MSINLIKSVIASKAGKGWDMLCKLSLPIVQEGIISSWNGLAFSWR